MQLSPSTLRNPDVTIEDNQTGKSFDGQNTVAYKLTFTEGVQKIDATDLTVTGATVDSVVHTAGDTTATVNVTSKITAWTMCRSRRRRALSTWLGTRWFRLL